MSKNVLCIYYVNMLMIHENHQWDVGSKLRWWVPVEQEHKDQTKGTGMVPAKDPLKVKLVNQKSLRTL